MTTWLLLLLPIAAASGWWAAKRSGERQSEFGSAADSDFLRRLSYLLNEQSDKAIDVFLKLAEVDGETADTHLALGNLFRRRGEVGRAIRIHQNLVSRPNLNKAQRGYALFELGQDYMRAGLFDRAEKMFRELVGLEVHCLQALSGLREIYQQEKDWKRCLEVARQMQSLTGQPARAETAQYHCELAEELLKEGDATEAIAHLRQAQTVDPQCARAIMLQARIAMSMGKAGEAVTLFHRVAQQRPQYLQEILEDLLEAYRLSGRKDQLFDLKRLYQCCPSARIALTLANRLLEEEGDEVAIDFLVDHLSRHADLIGLERLLQLNLHYVIDDTRAKSAYDAVLVVVKHLRSRQPDYQCANCGFVARRLHWLCPSCKQWGSIQPFQPEPIADSDGFSTDDCARRELR